MTCNHHTTNIFNELKQSLVLSIPLIATEVIYALNGFVATIMISGLGKEYLAANALAWNIYIAIILFTIGILCAISTMTAHSFGANDHATIGICFKQGMLLAIAMAVPVMLALRYAPDILILAKQDRNLINLATPLFYSLAWTILPLNVLTLIEQFLIGIGKTKIVTAMSIAIIPMQIGFTYMFLHGYGGLPKLTLSAIGYGGTLAYTTGAIFFIIYIKYSQQFQLYQLLTRCWIINKKILCELIRIGLPLGLTWCIEVAMLAVIAIMMGVLGADSLAAYQITCQYIMLALAFIFAFMQTANVRIGIAVGQKNRHNLKLAFWVNTAIGLVAMLIFGLGLNLFATTAISLDLDMHAVNLQPVVKQATVFLMLAGILIIAEAIRLITAGALRGIKDTRFILLASIIGFWFITLPGAYLLAFKLHWGGAGIYTSMIMGMVITGIILVLRFNYMIKNIDLGSLVTKAE